METFAFSFQIFRACSVNEIEFSVLSFSELFNTWTRDKVSLYKTTNRILQKFFLRTLLLHGNQRKIQVSNFSRLFKKILKIEDFTVSQSTYISIQSKINFFSLKNTEILEK